MLSYAPTPATPTPSPVLGSVTPRLWTPPLVTGPPGPCGCGCALTPATSKGFDHLRFAKDELYHPLDPWQRFAVIHGGELLPDGRPRGRIVLVLVSRQNGKTEIPVVLSAYWQFVESVPLILGTSTKLDYAKESWTKAVKLVERSPSPDLAALRGPRRWKRETNGEQESWTVEDSRYKIAASNAEGGRSLTVHRLVLDELRQHHDYSAWDAAEPATAAVRDAQIWALSNAGDDNSIVLNDLRESALEFIAWTELTPDWRSRIDDAPGDYRLLLLEWSCPEDADPTDVHALAMANPNLGHRLDPEPLLLKAKRSVAKGGQVLAGFKTENMCIRVPSLGDPPPIDTELWHSLADPASAPAGDVGIGVHVGADQKSAAIAVYGPRADDLGHAEVVAVRTGAASVAALATAIATLRTLHNPVGIALFGAAPEVLQHSLAEVGITVPDDVKRPARGDLAVPKSMELAEAWSGFLAAVNAAQLRHRDQPPLTAAVADVRTKNAGRAQVIDFSNSTGDVGPLNAVIGARWVYEQRAQAIVGDVVYEDWNPARHVLTRVNIPKAWPRYLSVRFGGATMPFVAQWWAESPSDQLIMYREIYMTGRLVEEHARMILARSTDEPRPVAVIADRDADERLTLQRGLGQSTVPAHTGVADAIEAVTSRLRTGRLAVLRDALVERDATLVAAGLPTDLASEIPGYAWAPGGAAPLEGADAGVTAMRWMVAHRDLRKRAGTRGWIVG